MKRLGFSAAARRDIRDTVEVIAAEDPAAAGRLVQRLEAAADVLVRFPELGMRISDTRRALTVRGTPYRPIYAQTRRGILILRIWHGARGWPPVA